MDLRFSKEENAFRQELRTFFRTAVPEVYAQKGDGESPPHQGRVGRLAQNPALQGPHRPALAERVGWLRLDARAALHLHRGAAVQRRAAAACPSTCRCAGRSSSPSARRSRRSGSCRGWHLSTTGGARASRSRARAPICARSRRPPCARATTTSSTARRPGPRWPSTPTGSSASCAPIPSAKKQLGISFILIDMKTPGVTVRPIQTHRRRPRGQRGLLRRRQGAGREAGRRGEPRLGLRQVPARQRAHRHRPRRLFQAARARIKELASKVMAGDRPLIDDDHFREKIAAVEVDLKSLEMTQMRFLAEDSKRKNSKPNPMSSMLKLKGSEIQQATTALLMEVAGPLALPYQMERDEAEHGSNEPPGTSIGRLLRRRAISTTARRQSTAALTRSSATSSPRRCWGSDRDAVPSPRIYGERVRVSCKVPVGASSAPHPALSPRLASEWRG